MKITEDGFVRVRGKSGIGGGKSIIYLSGTAGGATVTLGYYDDYNSFILLTGGLLTLGEQYQVDSGMDRPIYAQIAGASGTTAISLIVNGKV